MSGLTPLFIFPEEEAYTRSGVEFGGLGDPQSR